MLKLVPDSGAQPAGKFVHDRAQSLETPRFLWTADLNFQEISWLIKGAELHPLH